MPAIVPHLCDTPMLREAKEVSLVEGSKSECCQAACCHHTSGVKY